jgi:hypothetical protein
MLAILIIVLAVGLAVALVIIGYRLEKKRREAFQSLAARLGMTYTARDSTIASQYRFLDALCRGENRYAYNVLSGTFEGYPARAFDFHYETHSHDSRGRRTTHHHHFSFFLIEQEKAFPELRIYPEDFLSKLGQMMGFDDIDFESIEFSKAFVVRSADRKFAYDVCHTRMMEYLLAHRELSVEVEGRCIAISFNSRLKPEEVPVRLRQLVEIRRLFPEYLYHP